MNKYLILALACFISAAGFSQASQYQRFSAAAVFGGNFSQIDGDQSAGFNKFGIYGGIRSKINFKPNQQIQIEMLYSGRGSRTGANESYIERKIKLGYIEVPVLYNYQDWLVDDSKYYKATFSGGLSYGRLIHASHENSTHSFAIENGYLNKNDISYVLGMQFNFTKHLALAGRFSHSITYIFNPHKYTDVRLNSLNVLIGRFFSFLLVYDF